MGVSPRPAVEFISETAWNRFADFVVEPGEIRVLTPDDAFRFWEEWAKTR